MVDASNPLVQELLNGRRVACLATENADGSIHLTAVWYLFDGGHLYVATSSRSAKARNLRARPKASVMVDIRDTAGARGVTAIGKAEILTGEESQRWNRAIHQRYLSEEALKDPRVGPVFAQWDDVTLRLKPARFFAWDMREADQQAFGGAFAARPDYMLPLD
jgi:PPOX class probable F420-dependent enzyme